MSNDDEEQTSDDSTEAPEGTDDSGEASTGETDANGSTDTDAAPDGDRESASGESDADSSGGRAEASRGDPETAPGASGGSTPSPRGELVWFLVDRSEQHGAVEAVARSLEEKGVETEVVTITEVLGSAAREAVAGGAERILRGLRIALQGRSGQEDFLQAIRREQPDLLVVTSPRYARPLSLLESVTATTTAQIGVPLDFNLGPAWLNGTIDAFVAPDESAVRRIEEAGYGEKRLFRAGPPLLPNFERDVDRAAVREELGFGDESVVLVRAESFDDTAIDRIVFQATLVERDVRFVFHHNGDGAVSQTLRRSADHHGLSAAMFGRVGDLERYVTAADVVLAAPTEPYLPEIVRCARPVYLVGTDEEFGAQVDVLTRDYGAEHLADVLRMGSELEAFLDPTRLEEVEQLASDSSLAPSNDDVADALITALERADGWREERPRTAPEQPTDEGGAPSESERPTGPFESIGTGESGRRGGADQGRREARGQLEPADDRAAPRPSISRAEAKDQLAELILDERKLERRLSELEREQQRWRNRLELARDWGEEDLAEEAKGILRDFIDDASAVEDELADVRRQKTKLKRAAGRGEGATAAETEPGEPIDDERAAELEQRFEEMELERDLDDLRDRVEGELGE